MEIGVKPRKLAFIYVIIVIVTCCSLLYGWIPVLHKQVYVCTLAMLASLFIAPRYYRTPLFFITLFYALLVWANAQWGDEYAFDRMIMDGLVFGVAGSLSFYIMKSNDQSTKKWISIFIMAIIIIQTIPSVAIYYVAGDTIRNFMVSEDTLQMNYDWEQMYRFGMLAYPMTHSLPMLVPPLIMSIRNKGVNRKWKFLCFITLICICILVLVYDVTTVQFLVIFCLLTSLLIKPGQSKHNRQRVILLSFIILPFLLSTQLQVGILNGIETIAPGGMKEKVADMRYNILHDDNSGDMGNRTVLYQTSLDSFIGSPIIGVDSYSEIGDHSALIDRMAAFGLIGFIPYLLVLIITTRICLFNMSPSCRWYYVICIISLLSLLLLKNMSHLEVWIVYLVVTPSLFSLNEQKNSY